MSFAIAFVLVVAAGAFYLAGNFASSQLTVLCSYSPTLCQHPEWFLYLAGAFLLWGLLLKVDRI